MRRLSGFFLCLGCGSGPVGGAGDGSTAESSSAGVATTVVGATTSTGEVAAPTSGGSGGASTGGTSTGGGEGSGADTGGLVVDCRTELVGQRLAFVCNVPGAVADCRAGPACDDVDEDGLTDLWEDLLLAAMRPVRRFDEDEMLLADPTAVVGDVGRVATVGERVHVYVMLGYSIDYGSCGFTGHNGDSERVVVETMAWPDGGAGGAIVTRAYTAAHEGTASDHGRVFTGAELDVLVFTPDVTTADPRWVVFPSADKHATYATVEICENISPIPCLDEDCAPDDVDDPAKFDVLPPVVNAGEEAAPRVTELAQIGFAGEQAWAQQDFCGGSAGRAARRRCGTSCSSTRFENWGHGADRACGRAGVGAGGFLRRARRGGSLVAGAGMAGDRFGCEAWGMSRSVEGGAGVW